MPGNGNTPAESRIRPQGRQERSATSSEATGRPGSCGYWEFAGLDARRLAVTRAPLVENADHVPTTLAGVRSQVDDVRLTGQSSAVDPESVPRHLAIIRPKSGTTNSRSKARRRSQLIRPENPGLSCRKAAPLRKEECDSQPLLLRNREQRQREGWLADGTATSRRIPWVSNIRTGFDPGLALRAEVSVSKNRGNSRPGQSCCPRCCP